MSSIIVRSRICPGDLTYRVNEPWRRVVKSCSEQRAVQRLSDRHLLVGPEISRGMFQEGDLLENTTVHGVVRSGASSNEGIQ